jgi:hypothetical protein
MPQAALSHLTKFSKTGLLGTGEHLLFILIDESLILISLYNTPHCILKTKPGITVPVAASGFQKVADLIAPICPHAYNKWHTMKNCKVVPY